MISRMLTEAEVEAVKSLVLPSFLSNDDLTRRLQRKLEYRHFRLIEVLEESLHDGGRACVERVEKQLREIPDWLTRTIAVARIQKPLSESVEAAVQAVFRDVMTFLGIGSVIADKEWNIALANNLMDAEKELF